MSSLSNCSKGLREALDRVGIGDYEVLAMMEIQEVMSIAKLPQECRPELELLLGTAVVVAEKELRQAAKEIPLATRPTGMDQHSKFPSCAVVAKRRGCIPPPATRTVRPRIVIGDARQADLKAAKREQHVQQLCDVLWAKVMDLGNHSTLWSERFTTAEGLKTAKTEMMRCWRDTENLGSHVTALVEWTTFMEKSGLNWRVPDVLSEQIFLRSFESRGATVPKSKLRVLLWAAKRVGIPFNSDAISVRDAARVPDTHVETQIPELQPRLWFVFERMLKDKSVFVVAIALYWVFLVITVLRPKHLQMSRIVFLAGRIQGEVEKGKSRVQGKRRPFSWAAPRQGLSQLDLEEAYTRVASLSGCGTLEKPGLLLDFLPARVSLKEVTHFAETPMPRGKILRYTGEALRKWRVSEELIQTIQGLYAARRTLPTIGDLVRLTPEQRLDLGDWVDQQAQQRVAMPNRYSSGRMVVMAETKQAVIKAARKALQGARDKLPDGETLSWITWQELQWPRLVLMQTEEADASQSSHVVAAKLEARPEMDVKKETPAKKDSSSDESSSSSDTTQEKDDSDAEEVEPFLEWQRSQGVKGCLHLATESGLACGRQLRRPLIGAGMSNARACNCEWSPRCWHALTEHHRKWWSEQSIP